MFDLASTQGEQLTISAAAVLGAVASLAALLLAITAARRASTDTKRLTDEAELAALDSFDLGKVGKYLFDTVGSVRIDDYVRDRKLRLRTEKAIKRLAEFVGTEPEEAQEPPPPSRQILEEMPTSNEVELARRSIEAGDLWGGLARLRKFMEIRFSGLFPQIDSERMSLSGYIELAHRRGLLNDQEHNALRFALNVANRAVHGEDVSVGTALYALECVRSGMARLPDSVA
jgi:hypothetical protein